MSKLIKLLCIGGLALSLIGGVTLFGLYLTTGIHSLDVTFPSIKEGFSNLTISRSGITFFNDDDNKKTTNIKETYDAISGVDIDCSNCNITIKETKGNKVLVEGNRRSSSTIVYDLKEGILTITLTNPETHFNNSSDSLTLSLPDDTVLVDSKIDVKLGNIKFNDVDFVNLDLHAALGDIKIKDSNIDTANILLNLGDLEFEGDLRNKISVINNLGNITMDIDEDLRNVTYDCTLSLGDFRVNHKKEDSIFQKESSTEKLNISIDSSLGDVDLNFDD